MLHPSNERCLYVGHVFVMDPRRDTRACARCGTLEIDHAIEYLSSLRHKPTPGQQRILTWAAEPTMRLWTPVLDDAPAPAKPPYLWGGGHRKPPVASRIEKVEGNVITVRFGGKV